MKRRLDWLQQYSKKANKNKSAYAFEIINLQYHDTDAGSRQLEIDRKGDMLYSDIQQICIKHIL